MSRIPRRTAVLPPAGAGSPPLGSRRRRAWAAEAVAVKALLACAVLSVAVTFGIVAVLVADTVQFFREYSPLRFFSTAAWAPQGDDGGEYGVLQLLNGTLMIAVGALVVGLPLGLATAIYLSEYARPRARAVLKPTLELLAGIPTVVVGFFALNFVTPLLLRPLFGEERVGIFNAASGALVVGLMILPIIASISEDAMRAVPAALREGAYALGASRRQATLRVVVPAALSGITASVILGLSRAIGETMAVTLAAGNTPKFTLDFLTSIQTLTAAIAQIVQGEAAGGSLRYHSLFALGLTLFAITLLLNAVSMRFVRRFRQVYQ